MRVLVTGGTGYLGAAIVRALHARGHQPVVYARRATSGALPGVAMDGDVRDPAALRRAAEGADAIVHAAALVTLWRPAPREFDDVNVNGLLNVLAVARALATPRLVYTSSFLAQPPAGAPRPLEANDYQRTKVRGLDLARRAAAEGQPVVIMVPGVVYGPGTDTEGNLVGRMVRDHLAGRLPGIIGADRVWSYSYVDDVASAHVSAAERPGIRGEYVVGGENVPQRRVFEILRELTGRPLPLRLSFPVAAVAAAAEERVAAWRGRAPRLTRGTVHIFRHDWTLDSACSIHELGYRITPLREGLERVLQQL